MAHAEYNNGEEQMQAKFIEQCDVLFAEENTYSKQIAS